MSRFSIAGALAAGWHGFVANFAPMALYAVIVLLVNFFVGYPAREAEGLNGLLWNFIGFLVSQCITIGWLRIALDIVDGRPVSAERVRNSFEVLLPFFVAAILFSVMVAIGFVLLIVPGIILAVIFGFYGWVLVDGRERKALLALGRSADITRGHRLHLVGFGLVLLVFNIVGLLLFVVGVFVTSAVSILAVAHVYRRLTSPGV